MDTHGGDETKLKLTRALLRPATTLVALLAVVVVVAAFTSFTHTSPVVPVTGDLVGNCDENDLEKIGTIQLGIDGRLAFRCNTPGAALTVSGAPIEMEPAVSTGGYDDLFIVRGAFANADDCTTTGTGSQSIEIVDATEVVITVNGDYNYCATYTNPSTINLAAWSVTWGV